MAERLETSEWWAALGTYRGQSGTFLTPIPLSVPEALRQETALRKLSSAVKRCSTRSSRAGLLSPTKAQPAWEGLESCVEDVIQKHKEHYTRMSPDVYFFED